VHALRCFNTARLETAGGGGGGGGAGGCGVKYPRSRGMGFNTGGKTG
jgi:hypothetical protein